MSVDFGLESIRDGSYEPEPRVPPAVSDLERANKPTTDRSLIDMSYDPRAPGVAGPTAADRERCGKAYEAALEVAAAAQLAFDASRSVYQAAVADIALAVRRDASNVAEAQQHARDRQREMLEAQDALRIARAAAEEAKVALAYACGGISMFAGI